MKTIFVLFLLLNLGWGFTVLGSSPPTDDPAKKPAVILKDSYGNAVFDSRMLNQESQKKTFGLSDSVFGSFFNLTPCNRHRLSITRDGKEVSHLFLRSDEQGVISTTALWWRLGFHYCDADSPGDIDPDFANHEYGLILKDEKGAYAIDIIIPVLGAKWVRHVYTCDNVGNPKNTFIRNRDHVYLKSGMLQELMIGIKNTGKDTDLPEEKLYIYVVKHRWSWRPGDRVDGESILKQKYIATLSGGVLDTPQLVWRDDDLEAGGYDIIVSDRNMGMVLETDIIESNYGVGFKVVDEPIKEQPGEKKDITQRLTCQTPAHIMEFGNLDKPRAAIYKEYFSPVEQVWTALETLNPTPAQRKAKKARIYVLKHRNGKIYRDGEPLRDESGGFEEVLLQPQCARAVFTRIWGKPVPREEGFDVVLDFPNAAGAFGTYDKGLDILDNGVKLVGGKPTAATHLVYGKTTKKGATVEHGGFYVPQQWVCLESLSLNHTKNAICSDAVTIRYRMGEKIRTNEWEKGKRSFPAAYVKGSRIAVQPGFTASDDVVNATLKAYAASGSLGDIKTAQAFFYKNKNKKKPPLNESTENYFQVATNTPGKINSFYQQWDWYLIGIYDSPNTQEVHIGSTINKIYIILDVPQSPWTLSGDTAPWSDILDLCCQVARGESEPAAATGKITQFLYREVGAVYDKTSHYPIDDGVFSDFQLTKFHRMIPNVHYANCYDMGKALVTYGNLLGCNLTLRYCRSFGALHCIKPVGEKWKPSECFNNHAFASQGDNIFDASLKVNSRGNPDQKPYRAAWMINIPWCDYKEMVVKKALPWCNDEETAKKKEKTQLPYPQIAIFKIADEK